MTRLHDEVLRAWALPTPSRSFAEVVFGQLPHLCEDQLNSALGISAHVGHHLQRMLSHGRQALYELAHAARVVVPVWEREAQAEQHLVKAGCALLGVRLPRVQTVERQEHSFEAPAGEVIHAADGTR